MIEVGGRVIRLAGPRRFEAMEAPVPVPGRDEVVLAVRALGICGTDLHLWGGRSSSYPQVLGHDGAATVHAVGPGVAHVSEGDRVAVDPISSCGACDACANGSPQLCPRSQYLGMATPGLLAEFVRLPAVQAVPLPASVSDLAATVLEPVAVALHMLRRVSPLLPEPVPAGVVGGGPLGILLGLVLEHFGYEVHVFEPLTTRRELAAALGLRSYEPTAVDIGDGRRLIVETSASSKGVRLAEELCTNGSVVAVVGRAPETIRPAAVLDKELSIQGVKGGARRYGEAIELVARAVVDPVVVITHRFGWADVDRAFETNAAHPEEVVRAALEGPWKGTE